ncbi:MAG: hypothetical protein IJF82_20775 [Achromobacter sp.]|nr:hypothetical protein [Achromobacter sp.]MBQ3612717.1 hypothetical protein [Bacteroidales bacterium]
MRPVDADNLLRKIDPDNPIRKIIEAEPTVKPIVGEDGMAFSEISKVLIAEATDLRVQRKNEGAEALEEMAAFFSLIGEKVHGKD